MGSIEQGSDALHLIIIGAGLAGLAAALATKTANPSHQVTILEVTKELAEVGVSLAIIADDLHVSDIFHRLVFNSHQTQPDSSRLGAYMTSSPRKRHSPHNYQSIAMMARNSLHATSTSKRI